MPKLLQINATANWGSTGRIAEQIGLAAMARGWESFVAYGRYANPSMSQLIRIGSSGAVYEHYMEHRLLDNEGLASRMSTRKLIDSIRSIDPDIIHLHNIHDHYLNYKALFAYLNSVSKPVIWTFHDCWAFTGHCCYFDSVDCKRWKNGCCSCPLSKSLIDRSQRNYLVKSNLFRKKENLVIVPVSEWLAGNVRESFLNEKRIEVIHNGIDLKKFSHKDGTNDGRFHLLGVSNVWDARKGLHDFVKLKDLIGDGFRVTLVGLSSKQIKDLPEGISGIERTTSVQELAQLYSSADVLLSLSYAETFGMTIVEAAACGTPAVVYDNTGQKDLVTSDTGIVVPTGDVAAVYDAIKKIRGKGKDTFREACRARAEKYFDKDKCFEKYVDLYEELIRE